MRPRGGRNPGRRHAACWSGATQLLAERGQIAILRWQGEPLPLLIFAEDALLPSRESAASLFFAAQQTCFAITRPYSTKLTRRKTHERRIPDARGAHLPAPVYLPGGEYESIPISGSAKIDGDAVCQEDVHVSGAATA